MPGKEKRKVAIQIRIDKDDLDELLGNTLTDVAAQAVMIAVRTYNKQAKAKGGE